MAADSYLRLDGIGRTFDDIRGLPVSQRSYCRPLHDHDLDDRLPEGLRPRRVGAEAPRRSVKSLGDPRILSVTAYRPADEVHQRRGSHQAAGSTAEQARGNL